MITVPVPSTLPTSADPERVADWRRYLDPQGSSFVIGHFGTYGAHITRLLLPLFRELLTGGPKRRIALLGRGSSEFARELQSQLGAGDRVAGRGESSADEVVAGISACDVLVQPYPEGVTTRRSSLIASLALGSAVVTNHGALTEPFWHGRPGVVVAPSLGAMSREVDRLERDRDARSALRDAAGLTYDRNFAPRRTADALRDLA
jgi:glycosyltransferase involved in cell wall biosynthesis